jgi:biotin synthase-like enzyme
MRDLDLHGVRHAEVKGEVIRFIEEYWDTEDQLTVITGHSPTMRMLVIEVLEEYGLEGYIGGMFGMGSSFITFYPGSSSV